MIAFLRKALASRRRARALTRLRNAAADGSVDLALLEVKQNYRR
jgi:hypothetical protein